MKESQVEETCFKHRLKALVISWYESDPKNQKEIMSINIYTL